MNCTTPLQKTPPPWGELHPGHLGSPTCSPMQDSFYDEIFEEPFSLSFLEGIFAVKFFANSSITNIDIFSYPV
jgi:hypothetical protein